MPLLAALIESPISIYGPERKSKNDGHLILALPSCNWPNRDIITTVVMLSMAFDTGDRRIEILLKELQRHYDQLENERLELIGKIRRLDPSALRHKPAPERWSILEDIQHLVLAEQTTALKIGTAAVSGTKRSEMLAMVLHVLDQDVVVDVPDPAMVPDGKAALEDLICDWDKSRKRLRRFLDDCGTEDLQTPIAYHAVAGPLTVTEFLRLIASHFNHHRRRIEAAIEHS